MAIQRLFVTKRESFNQEAQRMLLTLQQELSMQIWILPSFGWNEGR